jgi:membrane glycosyltransferase
MGLVLALLDPPRRRALGGRHRLIASTLLETLYSALLAPVMMLFHTGFVLQILLGGAIDWKPQRRQAGAGPLAETARRFGWVTLLGMAASVACAWATPELFYWLIPVLGGLVFAIPLAFLSGDEGLGDRLRALRLLPVTEEACPPPVMRRLDQLLASAATDEAASAGRDRFAEVVLDPGFNALHIAALRAAGETPTVPAEAIRPAERKAVYLGPAALDKPERRMLLEHPASMARLHLAAWLHWRTEQPLAWETDEQPPASAPGRGVGEPAERAAAA